MISRSVKDLFLLHFIVFVWGFTGVLGKLITIQSLEMVTYRSSIATLALGLILFLRKVNLNIHKKAILRIIGVGIIIGFHWIFFFASIKVSTVSVCLAGLATMSLWTSILEPLIIGRSVKSVEIFLGVVVIVGLYLIFQFEINHVLGLIFGIISAFLAALFSVINGTLSTKYNHYVITFYELLGAFFGCLIAILLVGVWLSESYSISMEGTPLDFFYLAVLALVCTVYPFATSVELMKRLSVFSINLTVNLEPVYGILLAIVIFKENEQLSAGFYAGTLIILAAVILHPLINRYRRRKAL